jgi:heme oxygenase
MPEGTPIMMTTTMPGIRVDLTRSKRLKIRTSGAHERLERLIAEREPFASRERYAVFLKGLHDFHRAVDFLYSAPELRALIFDLPAWRSLDAIRLDIADLGRALPPLARQDPYLIDAPNALGWLYVTEGADFGAASFVKQAGRLGLSANFGARHLAGSAARRARQWRALTAALDAMPLCNDDELRLVAGAETAFALVHGLLAETFAAASAAPMSSGPARSRSAGWGSWLRAKSDAGSNAIATREGGAKTHAPTLARWHFARLPHTLEIFGNRTATRARLSGM